MGCTISQRLDRWVFDLRKEKSSLDLTSVASLAVVVVVAAAATSSARPSVVVSHCSVVQLLCGALVVRCKKMLSSALLILEPDLEVGAAGRHQHLTCLRARESRQPEMVSVATGTRPSWKPTLRLRMGLSYTTRLSVSGQFSARKIGPDEPGRNFACRCMTRLQTAQEKVNSRVDHMGHLGPFGARDEMSLYSVQQCWKSFFESLQAASPFDSHAGHITPKEKESFV